MNFIVNSQFTSYNYDNERLLFNFSNQQQNKTVCKYRKQQQQITNYNQQTVDRKQKQQNKHPIPYLSRTTPNIMNQQSSQQQWSLLYYRKKAQFNEYVQFKAKSFQYQKFLGSLNYLANDDEDTQRKQMKQLLMSLNDTMDQMRNIFSEIHQQMKFLKLSNFSTLIQSVQELIAETHHFLIENFKRRLQYGHKDKTKQDETGMETCRKCLGSINQLNLKRLYDEITTTESNQDEETNKMTRQQRRKMISQLDQYDILLAEKENYLRKVNALLEKKGKVGELSNHDKTYNFLSQYLSKIQKIQQRRNKTSNKTDPDLQQDRKWQQQSYKHILQYIKRVLFQHFVNQCSGPVKKMFQKVNIDKLFKSFGDHQHGDFTNQKHSLMQNHETQTAAIPQMQQLKMVQKKLDFKVKQIALLKTNKQQLQKKYIVCLDEKRKLQSDMFEVKKQRKWFESEMTIAQQNLKKLTEKYQQAAKNYEQDLQRTIQRYINEREKVLWTTKTMEAEFAALEEEHKKCERMRNKAKECQAVETQTVQQQFVELEEKDDGGFLRVEALHNKRRKSKINKMLSTPMSGQRRNVTFSRDSPAMCDNLSQDTILQHDDYHSSRGQINTKFSIQSHKIDFNLDPSSCGSQNYQQQEDDQMDSQNGKAKQRRERNSVKKFNRGRLSEEYENFSTLQRTLTAGDEIRTYQDIRCKGGNDNRQIKISINAFKKIQQPNINNTGQQLEQVTQQGSSQNSPSKLSNFNTNRLAQGCEGSLTMNKSLGYNVTSPELFASMRKGKAGENNKSTAFMVSQRLYSRKKRKQSKQLPFERVIENGKQKFYIKKISRQSTNYKLQKQRMKQISQILKPYVYNNHNLGPSPPKATQSQPKPDLKSIRQRLNWLGHKQRFPKDTKSFISFNKSLVSNEKYQPNEEIKIVDTLNQQQQVKHIGHEVVTAQQIVQSEYAYLKAVGFIDFLMKIGKDNKKMATTINNIQHEVKEKFKSPQELDLELFGGRKQAENYTKGRSFWMLDQMKDNIMIYNKNDGLSAKVQKYFTLLKRANPQLYGILMVFLTDPIFAVFGQKMPKNQTHLHRSDDSNFVRDLFNQLQKYHKIKHNQCTHIIDFLEKIGFYKYTYF